RSGDMEIDHKPESSRPLRCDVDHLRQKIEVRSTSTVRQQGTELFASPETISRHLAAMGSVKKLFIQTCIESNRQSAISFMQNGAMPVQ
ncbi:hypothetical protein TNIN_357441, partial [Trichonephila inaurata madagascariensis]